jgi:hypothetical protein
MHGGRQGPIEGASAVTFEVRANNSAVLATSVPFDSICRLEAALGTLSARTREDWRAVERDGKTTVIVGEGRRGVRLDGRLTTDQVAAVVATVADATIVDERPANRRRQDLTGLCCDLSH